MINHPRRFMIGNAFAVAALFILLFLPMTTSTSSGGLMMFTPDIRQKAWESSSEKPIEISTATWKNSAHAPSVDESSINCGKANINNNNQTASVTKSVYNPTSISCNFSDDIHAGR